MLRRGRELARRLGDADFGDLGRDHHGRYRDLGRCCHCGLAGGAGGLLLAWAGLPLLLGLSPADLPRDRTGL